MRAGRAGACGAVGDTCAQARTPNVASAGTSSCRVGRGRYRPRPDTVDQTRGGGRTHRSVSAYGGHRGAIAPGGGLHIGAGGSLGHGDNCALGGGGPAPVSRHSCPRGRRDPGSLGPTARGQLTRARDSWDSPDLTAGAEEPMSGLEPAVLAAVAFTSRPFGPRSCLSFVSGCTSSRSAHAPAPPARECACPSCSAGQHARFACTGRSGCGATRRSAASRRHFIRTTVARGRADRTTPCGM